MADISALSNETIWQQVTLTHPVAGVQDLRSYPVQMALVTFGDDPADADWFNAAWENSTDSSGYYLAYAEIGPNGAVTLTAGLYQIWLRVTLPAERPVARGETVNIF